MEKQTNKVHGKKSQLQDEHTKTHLIDESIASFLTSILA